MNQKNYPSVTKLFNKEHMIYQDYIWSNYIPDDPRISGEPDDTLFHKNQGQEVLYLINWIGQFLSHETLSLDQQIEMLIHDCLPASCPQITALQTIRKVWREENIVIRSGISLALKLLL